MRALEQLLERPRCSKPQGRRDLRQARQTYSWFHYVAENNLLPLRVQLRVLDDRVHGRLTSLVMHALGVRRNPIDNIACPLA